jgi:hypothetical protein
MKYGWEAEMVWKIVTKVLRPDHSSTFNKVRSTTKKSFTMYPHLIFRKPFLWEPLLWQKKSLLYFTIDLFVQWNDIQSKRGQEMTRVFGGKV